MKAFEMTQKIRAMKVGEQFTVKTESDRIVVNRIAKTLRDSGMIKFTITTRRRGRLWKVIAI